MERKKRWYVPGIISLLGLPVLLLIFSWEDKPEYTCLRFFLPSDKKSDPGMIRYNRDGIYEAIGKKKIETVDLSTLYISSSYNYDRQAGYIDPKLNFIANEMSRLQMLHDTTVVLEVRLGEQNAYGDFVWLINQAVIYNFKRYAFIDNRFFLFPNPPPPPFPDESAIQPLVIDSVFVVESQTSHSQWYYFVKRLQDSWIAFYWNVKSNRLLSAGFLILILLPAVIRTINEYRRRTRQLIRK